MQTWTGIRGTDTGIVFKIYKRMNREIEGEMCVVVDDDNIVCVCAYLHFLPLMRLPRNNETSIITSYNYI